VEAKDVATVVTHEEMWRAVYIAQMVNRGVDRAYAEAVCEAGEHDYTDDPCEAADEEISHWADDGDEA
jgi:hypothetical protein